MCVEVTCLVALRSARGSKTAKLCCLTPRNPRHAHAISVQRVSALWVGARGPRAAARRGRRDAPHCQPPDRSGICGAMRALSDRRPAPGKAVGFARIVSADPAQELEQMAQYELQLRNVPVAL
eukprot:3521255-Rhodomonas_salina.1